MIQGKVINYKNNKNIEIVVCKNPACKRKFPRYKTKISGRALPDGVRPHHCKTCCPNCSKELSRSKNKERCRKYQKKRKMLNTGKSKAIGKRVLSN